MGRKYRQRGYQDEPERDRRDRRAPASRHGGDGSDGPRGRGLGRPGLTVFRCARCGERRQLADGIATDARCSACGADLHTCTHCRHFDTSARFECRAEIERRVPAKAKANECDLFAPRQAQELGEEARPASAPDDARAAFDALFDKL